MDQINELKRILSKYEKVAVAYSGGVDSSFLMAVAEEVLGKENVLGIYVDNGMHPRRERFDAYVMAEMLGWQVKVLDVGFTEETAIIRNGTDRCYHCKKAAFRAMKAYVEKKGYDVLIDGTNLDDIGEYRPGLRALEELGVKSPLKEAALGKDAVRKLSKSLYDLPTWNKPSNSCLATRIPYGTALTKENLATVDKGESYLHELGYLICRMRLHGELARIEIPIEDFQKFLERDRQSVAEYFKTLGIQHTSLDVLGFRSGSSDEGMTKA